MFLVEFQIKYNDKRVPYQDNVFCFSDIITTDIHIDTEKDLCRVLYMLRLCRKPGSPFEIRIVNWHLGVENISTLDKLFQEINPEVGNTSWFL